MNTFPIHGLNPIHENSFAVKMRAPDSLFEFIKSFIFKQSKNLLRQKSKAHGTSLVSNLTAFAIEEILELLNWVVNFVLYPFQARIRKNSQASLIGHGDVGDNVMLVSFPTRQHTSPTSLQPIIPYGLKIFKNMNPRLKPLSWLY